jgi:hypothetical protein
VAKRLHESAKFTILLACRSANLNLDLETKGLLDEDETERIKRIEDKDGNISFRFNEA